jgi:ribonuclease D
MSMTNLPKPTLITRTKDLRRLASRLGGEPILGVDTESNSLYAYQEQVCLIQFSTSQADFLVDPLGLPDLSPLGPVFANPEIEKVFHAAEYDLITLKRDFKFTFNNLFDTMLAARILGWEEVGLGSILKAEFGVQLNKHYQRANWGRRPLTPQLMDYARMDTHYLIPLRGRLKQALQKSGRWQLAIEDFKRMQDVNGRDPGDQPEACWRVNGSYDLSPQQAAVLMELCRYRDQVARALNRPLFKVIGDGTLMAIARALPDNLAELEQLPEAHPRLVKRHGEALLGAVQRGLRAEPVYAPRSPRPDERYLNRLEALRSWRKTTAEKMGVYSDVVLPRDLLHAIASANPHGKKELSQALHRAPWRLERFGDEILNLLAGV